MATKKATGRELPPTLPVCAREGCGHPEVRHWSGVDYPRVCLHGRINEHEPCDCDAYVGPGQLAAVR